MAAMKYLVVRVGFHRFAVLGTSFLTTLCLLIAISIFATVTLDRNQAQAGQVTKHTVCPYTLVSSSSGTYIYDSYYCVSGDYYGTLYFTKPPATLGCVANYDYCEEEFIGLDHLKKMRTAARDTKRTRFARFDKSFDASKVKAISQSVKTLNLSGDGMQMDGTYPYQIARFDDNKYARVFLVKVPLRDKSFGWIGFGFELAGKPDGTEKVVDMPIAYHQEDETLAPIMSNYYVLKQPDYDNSSDFIYYHVMMQAK